MSIAATLSTLKGSLLHYPLPPAFTMRYHHHHHHHHHRHYRLHHLLTAEQATTVLPHYTWSETMAFIRGTCNFPFFSLS